jgi:dsDNA-specific endonuclease/ATPase MutS2
MIFKVGDKVLFKKDKQSGIIIKVNSLYKVLVKTIDGFDILVSVNDLARVEGDTDKSNSYGEVVSCQQDKVTSPKRKTKQQRSQSVLKVDLHIELLTSNYNYMDNFEIIQIQLNECHNKIETALNSNFQKLIIVHGVGTGVLKTEVHNLLNNYKLRYYLSKDAGATEVLL